jgi:ribosomal protein L11 methylase PrmA
VWGICSDGHGNMVGVLIPKNGRPAWDAPFTSEHTMYVCETPQRKALSDAIMESLAATEYDVVLVNIVADVIIGLSPVLPNFLTKKSTLICSGILDTRLDDVLAALTAQGLTILEVKAEEDWRCVTACRNF